jgi:thiol-disulfide isomerase/thioredoxin
MRALFIAMVLALPAGAADPKPVELKAITYEGLDKAIAAEKGKVVAVDVWATFCAPCVKKFPNFVKLHEGFAEKGLVCISASTDDKDDAEKALKFLKDQKAHFANYRFSETNEKISKELNEKYPTDEQPLLILFNKKGEKKHQFGGKATPEEVIAAVKKLLEEK